jgi:2-polyprenyl-3-methyl-5-hydroxy-6-metoxy-1,4-benzoquinol methylase
MKTNIKILDVGGTHDFWEVFSPEGWEMDLTVLNLTKPNHASDQQNIRYVAGNAICMPEFRDKEFDVVFSNSVIEHVGTLRHQQMMANEVKRVGEFCFIQTPSKWFPIETHFSNIPYFQFLPKSIQFFTFQRKILAVYPSATKEEILFYLDSVRLLTHDELRMLFPECTIIKEKVWPFTKSYFVFADNEMTAA